LAQSASSKHLHPGHAGPEAAARRRMQMCVMYAYRLAVGKDRKDFLLKGISDKAGGRIYIGEAERVVPTNNI